MHEYHVDVQQPSGGIKTHRVNIEDEHHHSNWSTAVAFIDHLASIIGVAGAVVRGYKWVKRL